MIAQHFRRPAGRVTLAIPALMTLLLTGCTTPDPQMGLNVQTNVLAQVVEMDPVYAGVPVEGGSGERQVEAVRRYNKGSVKQLSSDSINKK